MLFRTGLLLSVALLFGCAQSVYTDYEQSYPYNDIRTFEIAAKPSTSPISLNDQRIQQALERELEVKGLVETTEDPDVTVRYRIVPRSENIAYGPTFSFGYGRRNLGIGYEAPIRMEERQYGQLRVEMVDPKTNQVIWKAVSNRKLTDTMTPSSKNAFINEQIAAMFEAFPPDRDTPQ